MGRKIEKQMQECYEHMLPYMNNESATKELRDMCTSCESYCGKDHDYEECREKPCFRLWLGWKYLDMLNS